MNQVENEIVKLEEQLAQLEMRVDVDALQKIYADDIMVTAPHRHLCRQAGSHDRDSSGRR